MDVAIIDYYANHGTSYLHKAHALSKIILTVFVITSILLTGNVYWLAGIYLILLSVSVWSKLPFIKIAVIAAYPAVFALLFVFASWNGDWTRAAAIMLKAVSSALAMVILIVTTPYPAIFNSLKPILPGVITDALFLTYRSLFLLLELTDGLLKGLRVRGGSKKFKVINNVKNFSSGIGLLLVRGFDTSEKLYGVMNVRGYRGKISAGRDRYRISQDDAIVILTGALILAFTLAVKTNNLIDKYLIYAPAAALILFALSALYVNRYSYRGNV